MKTVMQLTDEILNASPEAQIIKEGELPELSDKQRNSMIGLTESNARITAKKAMRGESPKNAREKRAVRAKLDKSDSKARKVPLDVAAAAYEGVSIPDKKFQSIDDALNPTRLREPEVEVVTQNSGNVLTDQEVSILKEAAAIMRRLNENSKKGSTDIKVETTTVGAIGTGALKPVKGKVTLLKSNKKKKANESFNRFLDNIINEVKSN